MQRKLRMNLVPWRTPDVTMRIWELGKVPPQIGPLVDGGINMSTREILVLKTANERIPRLFDQFFTHFLGVANFPLAQMRHGEETFEETWAAEGAVEEDLEEDPMATVMPLVVQHNP